MTDEGFVLKKGTLIARTNTDSLALRLVKLKEQMITDGRLLNEEDSLVQGSPTPKILGHAQRGQNAMESIYDITVNDIDGNLTQLSQFSGKALLIVNTASKCGFTPQYAGLELLYNNYKDQGLVVLGFPCDQFGHQEPGDEQEIKSFCALTYNLTFPLFAKVEVNGPNASPLFERLKAQSPGLLGTEAIKWNFTKFLVDRNGKVVERYAPITKPEALKADIEALLMREK